MPANGAFPLQGGQQGVVAGAAVGVALFHPGPEDLVAGVAPVAIDDVIISQRYDVHGLLLSDGFVGREQYRQDMVTDR
jgi:hypothetical protein